MIVEFFGSPGAGKTFLATQIVSKFSTKKTKIRDIVELGRNNLFYKAMNKFIRVLIAIHPKYIELKHVLMEQVVGYSGRKAKYNNINLDTFLDNIVFYSFYYGHFAKKNCKVIFDEGIVHQYINIIANYEVPIDIIQKLHSSISYIPPVVYVYCTPEVNYISIKNRNRHVCYLDEFEGEDLKRLIMDYHKACESVCEIIDPVIVDRKNSVDRNIAIIRDKLNL